MCEKLVKSLRQCAEASCAGCKNDSVELMGCRGKLIIEAADAIENLDYIAQNYAETVHELKEENRWVSVTERLPEERLNPNTKDFEYVLCATIWGDVRPFKFGSMIGFEEPHFWHGSGSMDEYVTHWMPLPEPPKEAP